MIEKILERLENVKNQMAYGAEKFDYNQGSVDAYGNAIKIVQEVAQEYTLTNTSTNTSTDQLDTSTVQQNTSTDGWIPCSERLPENEKVVDITYVVAFKDRNVYYTARGFYTDGTLTTERSSYCWSEMDNWEYCKEEDSYIIPEGWWEDVTFGEEFFAIDRKVVAWMPLLPAYQPKGE